MIIWWPNFIHYIDLRCIVAQDSTTKTDRALIQNKLTTDTYLQQLSATLMGRLILWLRGLSGDADQTAFQSYAKDFVKFLVLAVMFITTPLIIGFFLLNTYFKFDSYIDEALQAARQEDLKEVIQNAHNEQIETGLEKLFKAPFKFPMFAIEDFDQNLIQSKCEELNSPIVMYGESVIVFYITNQKNGQPFTFTIKKGEQGWDLSKVPYENKMTSHVHSEDSKTYAAMQQVFGVLIQAKHIEKQLKLLKRLLKNTDKLYKLAIALPQVTPSSVKEGPSITELTDDPQIQQVLSALGTVIKWDEIPHFATKPWNKRDVFNHYQTPVYQYGGNSLVFLVKDRMTQQRKAVTFRKNQHGAWEFKQHIVSSYGSIGEQGTYFKFWSKRPDGTKIEHQLDSTENNPHKLHFDAALSVMKEVVDGESLYELETDFSSPVTF